MVKDHINTFTKSFTMFFTNENLTERDISDKELEDFKIVLLACTKFLPWQKIDICIFID